MSWIQRKLPEMSVFKHYGFEHNPVEAVRRFGREWKWAWQRVMHGYADCDAYMIRSWFLAVIPAMLEDMAHNLRSFPDYIGDGTELVTAVYDPKGEQPGWQEWQNTLLNIAKKIRDGDEMSSSIQNPYEEEAHKAYDEFREKYGLFGEKVEGNVPDPKTGSRKVYFPSDFDEWKPVMAKYDAEDTQIKKARVQSFNDGMALFLKVFWHLMD